MFKYSFHDSFVVFHEDRPGEILNGENLIGKYNGKEFIVDEPIKPESLFNFIASRFIDKRPD